MTKSTISLQTARRLALRRQLLDGTANLPNGRKGVAQVIEKLGYIQIDTISVIVRAHHHTLWTRLPDYDQDSLHELQTVDRRIFEYWGHQASYLPMSDYRFYLPLMKAFHDPHGKWEKERLQKYGHLMKPILKRIREEGPLGSKDFELEGGKKKKEGWWDWHGMKTALELLFWQGELMIRERQNFQRIYDLTERVLPDWVDTTVPSDEELGEFLVQRALSAHGITQEKEVANHLQIARKPIIKKALKQMIETGEIISLKLDGNNKDVYYCFPEKLNNSGKSAISQNVHIVSPFDNLIIQRDRIKDLFDFDYALECYTPPPKRKFGYFALPILWGECLVGRMDAKADRKPKTLIIRNMLFEESFNKFDGFVDAFTKKIRGFAEFNGCKRVEIEKVTPQKVKTLIKNAL